MELDFLPALIDSYTKFLVYVQSLKEFQKCVALIIDEMHVREDLVFDKHSGGKLVGFVNLGDVNNHMLRFEESLTKICSLYL